MRFDTDALYKQDLDVIKAKFTQLLDAGVREFGVLADDAAWPVGGYNSYNRLMHDLTDWLTEKQKTYSGLRKVCFRTSVVYGTRKPKTTSHAEQNTSRNGS